MSKPAKLYLVVRQVWEEDDPDLMPVNEDVTVVCGFTSRKAAVIRAAELEQEFHRRECVYRRFGYNWSEAETQSIREQALRLGLIRKSATEYAGEAKAIRPPTPDERETLWAIVPSCRVFRVVETSLKD